MYTVYMHTNTANGKRYIGITCQRPLQRWKNGKGYKINICFTNAINKYGWENFKHDILYTNLTKAQAEAKEIELIAKYKSNNRKYGYNIENGGNCVGTHSIETRKKLSKSLKGKKAWNKGGTSWNKGIKAWNKGIPMPAEKRHKMSKKIICITTNEIFYGLLDSSKKYNCDPTSISKCCNGKRKSAGKLEDGTKLVWRYL